ncbi:MAG TPA: hypothetical protein V6C71_18685 [Coleofasciculaceae cyanobacterium]|jgi:hypothetical protein
MLRQIDDSLWVAEQPLKFLGLEVGTRMTVVRLFDRSLVLISPIKIDSKIQQQLNTLGTVKYLLHQICFTICILIDASECIPNQKPSRLQD